MNSALTVEEKEAEVDRLDAEMVSPDSNIDNDTSDGWNSTAICEDFSFKLITDDVETTLEEYFQQKGLPLVICFYCSYVASCVRPVKTFSRNAEKMSGKAAFLLLNCDPMTTADKGCWAKDFAKSNAIEHCDHGYVDATNDKILCNAYE